MPYSPPDAAAFVDRIAAAPCCAAVTAEDHLDGALATIVKPVLHVPLLNEKLPSERLRAWNH